MKQDSPILVLKELIEECKTEALVQVPELVEYIEKLASDVEAIEVQVNSLASSLNSKAVPTLIAKLRGEVPWDFDKGQIERNQKLAGIKKQI